MTRDLALLFLAAALAAASNVMLRRGMRGLGEASAWRTLRHALGSPVVWAGGVGYVAAMGVWLVVLSSSELGLVYPIFTGGATLLVMLVSALALGEKLERRRLLGALLILAGIFVAHLE